jgi:hypothetical protein
MLRQGDRLVIGLSLPQKWLTEQGRVCPIFPVIYAKSNKRKLSVPSKIDNRHKKNKL